MPNWVYIALAWCVFAIAAMLLVWALFKDRSRGRKRCPSCWYDMQNSPTLTCPECGRRIRNEHQLHRTRRRWRFAVLAGVLFVGAWAIASVPTVQAHGAWGIVPRVGLIVALPYVEPISTNPGQQRPGSLRTQINRRLFNGPWRLASLWPWEKALLRTQCSSVLEQVTESGATHLAARFLVLLDEAKSLPPQYSHGALILARCGLTYARCSSYFDTGVVKGSIGVRDETPFATAFVRPGKFRFEFLSGHPFERQFSKRYVVWGQEPRLEHWWTIRSNIAPSANIATAIAGPTGISNGSAYTVPMMLVSAGTHITDNTNISMLADAQLDESVCYCVSATDFFGPVTYWIEKDTYLLRKIVQSGGVISTTVYRPRINDLLPDSHFEFDPTKPTETPLGDGEDVCRDLRPFLKGPNGK